MSDLHLIGLAVLAPALAFIALVTRIGHPHHRKIALALYLAGWVPFGIALGRHQETIRSTTDPAAGYLSGNWPPLAAACLTLVLAWVLWLLVPRKRSFLRTISQSDLDEMLDEDIRLLRYMLFRTDLALRRLLRVQLLSKKGGGFSEEDEAHLRALWAEFLAATLECDLLKNRYRAFPQVSVLKRKKQHFRCFLVAYGGFLAQYRAGLLLSQAVGDSDTLKAILNEASPSFPAGSFAGLQKRSITPESVVQLNAGRAYLSITNESLRGEQDITEKLENWLEEIDDIVAEDPKVFVGNPLDYFERKAFRFWFPVQKSIALSMSHVRTVSRPYFIRPDDITSYADRLEPGDILLQRREWHLTNLGIPGYWTHLALYVGTPERFDEFFDDIPATTERSASQLLYESCGAAEGALGEPDEHGFPTSVIEALRPGVVLNSLETSASTDAVAVLRPRLSKAKRLQGLLRAFEHLGKPYDYNFDFATDQALVCSELVYKAFRDLAVLQPEELGGRLLLSPNLLAKRFDAQASEADVPELEFVLFLDGQGKVGVFSEEQEEAFRDSHCRPKWHVLTESSEA